MDDEWSLSQLPLSLLPVRATIPFKPPSCPHLHPAHVSTPPDTDLQNRQQQQQTLLLYETRRLPFPPSNVFGKVFCSDIVPVNVGASCQDSACSPAKDRDGEGGVTDVPVLAAG